MTYQNAMNAAKKLANALRLNSSKGSIMVIIKDGDYAIVVDADADWRSKANVPLNFCGYEVIEQDRTIGRAYG